MAEKIGDVTDLLTGKWEMRKDREGNDTSEVICGGVHTGISIRLMGRPHADEVVLARVVCARMNQSGVEQCAPKTERDDPYVEKVQDLTARWAPFDHHEMVRITEEQVAALKAAVGWVGDEDFYSSHHDNPAKAAAKALFRRWNSARSIEKEAQGHAKSEAARGLAISSSGVGA